MSRPRSKPIICAVHGLCFTLGIELMLASDITLAAPRSTFAQAEVKLGLFPTGGATQRWVQTTGWGNTMRYLLTGEPFDEKTALRLGLIQEIVPKKDLLSRAMELAESIAANAPLAVQATLESSRLNIENSFATSRDLMLPRTLELLKTRDVQEGINAFQEKRSGVYSGN